MQCEFESSELPIGYRMLFVSLLKEALKRADESYFERLYYYDGRKNKATKNFTFAVLFNKFKLGSDVIEVEGKTRFLVSSPDTTFFMNLYNGLLQIREYIYKDYRLRRGKIVPLPTRVISDTSVAFKTLSPIHVRDKHGRSVDYRSPLFEKELNYILDVELKNFRGYGLKEPVNFEPLMLKKVVVKEEIRDFKRETDRRHIHLEAWRGTFRLHGDREDLQHLYELGIGFRRNQGFGMVEVI